MSTTRKILIVVESIDVEDSSGSKANVALIRNLKKAGYQLKVYHYTRKEIQLDGIDCYNIQEKRSSFLFFLSRTERYLRYLLKLKLYKPLETLFGFSFTLLNDRNSIISALKKEVNFKPDLVITLSKGGSFRPHHALLKIPRWHQKWLAYIHDPYPMHWYPPPYPWFEPGYKQKEEFMKKVALKCKVTGFPSRILMKWMGEKFGLYEKKGVVIPHQLEEREGLKTDVVNDDFSVEFNPSQFNVVHAGNLIRGREPFGLIEGFKKFLSSNPEATHDARLVLLGGRNYYSEYLDLNGEKHPQIIMSDSKLSFNETKKIQEAASVNIILEAKSEISPFLPGKFPHCVEANRKILLLSPPVSESRRLLGDDYRYWSQIDDDALISYLFKELYLVWKNRPENLSLNRPDLVEYLSVLYLKRTIESLNI